MGTGVGDKLMNQSSRLASKWKWSNFQALLNKNSVLRTAISGEYWHSWCLHTMLLTELEFISWTFSVIFTLQNMPLTSLQKRKKKKNNTKKQPNQTKKQGKSIQFCWMMIWAFWGIYLEHILQSIGTGEEWHKGSSVFYEGTLSHLALFLTHKQNDKCSFLCTWTNFHWGQMILCIATANLIVIYGFFLVHWRTWTITWTKKDSSCSASYSFFMTQVFQNFFKDTWHLSY